MTQLILVRHGITDWNKAGRWHGQSDISINAEGRAEADKDAQILKSYTIDKVYISQLRRTQETFAEIDKTLHLAVPIITAAALNERDYGIYTGQNKWQVKTQLGEETFNHLRRDWDYPIPEGESLKDVYERIVPYYQSQILPDLQAGLNVLIVSSGNTLRALTKFLENIPADQISQTELNFGEIDIYSIDPTGSVTDKKTLARDLVQTKH